MAATTRDSVVCPVTAEPGTKRVHWNRADGSIGIASTTAKPKTTSRLKSPLSRNPPWIPYRACIQAGHGPSRLACIQLRTGSRVRYTRAPHCGMHSEQAVNSVRTQAMPPSQALGTQPVVCGHPGCISALSPDRAHRRANNHSLDHWAPGLHLRPIPRAIRMSSVGTQAATAPYPLTEPT